MSVAKKMYRHIACGTVTTVPDRVVELFTSDPNYAADRYPHSPNYKNGTYCEWCHANFPRVLNGAPQFFCEPSGEPMTFPNDSK